MTERLTTKRLEALLLVMGPLNFRDIIAAFSERDWETGALRDVVRGMLRAGELVEGDGFVYALVD